MKNLKEISQVIFSILYGKIKKLKQHNCFIHRSLRSHKNWKHIEYQLQPYAKFELNPSTHFPETIWKQKNLKSIKVCY